MNEIYLNGHYNNTKITKGHDLSNLSNREYLGVIITKGHDLSNPKSDII